MGYSWLNLLPFFALRPALLVNGCTGNLGQMGNRRLIDRNGFSLGAIAHQPILIGTLGRRLRQATFTVLERLDRVVGATNPAPTLHVALLLVVLNSDMLENRISATFGPSLLRTTSRKIGRAHV